MQPMNDLEPIVTATRKSGLVLDIIALDKSEKRADLVKQIPGVSLVWELSADNRKSAQEVDQVYVSLATERRQNLG
ncbi:hypothetical protein FS749_005571 [Ceratobasidium sp. UAMH 11750]|nr:hypothetical protein FS749_005571 [Ceratobasidium sp. UAMH 11750]